MPLVNRKLRFCLHFIWDRHTLGTFRIDFCCFGRCVYGKSLFEQGKLASWLECFLLVTYMDSNSFWKVLHCLKALVQWIYNKHTPRSQVFEAPAVWGSKPQAIGSFPRKPGKELFRTFLMSIFKGSEAHDMPVEEFLVKWTEPPMGFSVWPLATCRFKYKLAEASEGCGL